MVQQHGAHQSSSGSRVAAGLFYRGERMLSLVLVVGSVSSAVILGAMSVNGEHHVDGERHVRHTCNDTAGSLHMGHI
jgi:hypothetical protein